MKCYHHTHVADVLTKNMFEINREDGRRQKCDVEYVNLPSGLDGHQRMFELDAV